MDTNGINDEKLIVFSVVVWLQKPAILIYLCK